MPSSRLEGQELRLLAGPWESTPLPELAAQVKELRARRATLAAAL